ncbi:acyl-CoA thioesterase YbgC [Pelotomaculum schinkii]|uniref:Acyl-CoA thioesterase YbgC n=1 Tax=Pelotomaculum schinkii TaxID=78350 RepID=A0A4Y7RB73_9FIRM|nr:thioesterase family protein [Pelotomaculum schinkii]TEB06066.1 acyl-CoA thioesterase YbgC [Pelotomaculum schinkii]
MKNEMVETGKSISNEQEMEVRWGDCDAAGIVYHARYFDLFTDGRVALLRQIGLPYQQTFHEQGIVVVAVEATCRYRSSLKPEDKYILTTKLTHLGRTRMNFEYVITKPETHAVAVEGRTMHAFVDNQGKPFDLKKRRPDLWEKLEERIRQ